MSEESNKWAIYQLSPGIVRVEFYEDPAGTKVIARMTFDEPAVREFATRLDNVVRTL